MRLPSYRKHSTSNRGFGQWEKHRTYFRGAYNSEESRREYEAWLRNTVLADSKLSRVSRDGSAVVSICLLLFLEHARRYYGDQRGSEYHNFRPVVSEIDALFGHLVISEITPLHLKTLVEHFAASPGKRGRTKEGKPKEWPRTRGYCNTCLRRTRQILKWLTEEGYCPASVYHGSLAVRGLKAGKTVAAEAETRQPVEWSAVERTLPQLSPTLAAMVRTQWLTGCRPGQVCAMRNDEIAAGVDGLWVWTPRRHKTAASGKRLTIFIGPQCQRVLLPFRSSDEYVFTPSGSRAGACYRPLSYYRAITRAAVRAGVATWTPHQIRHARGTEVEDRYDVLAAQATLGHAKIDTTKLYTSQAHARAKLVALETG